VIYFAQAVKGGPIKIRYTTTLKSRIRDLEIYYGVPLVILATKEGGRREEFETHKRFAHLRFDLSEQFRPAPDLMDYIGQPHQHDHDSVEFMERDAYYNRYRKIQLASKDLAAIEQIREEQGFSTMSATIKHCIHTRARNLKKSEPAS
jgi:hypothetical protein